MKTDECYIVLSIQIGTVKFKSDRIFGYKEIMKVGYMRDSENLHAKFGSRHPINIEERFGFNTFAELKEMHENE